MSTTKTFASKVFTVLPTGNVPLTEEFTIQAEDVDQARQVMVALTPELRKLRNIAADVPLQFITREVV